jgi:anti-anti-sigma factor
MLITKSVKNNIVILSIVGNMDTQHSVQLSDELDKVFSEGSFNIYLDMKGLNYISSSGLRVLLAGQKRASELGTKLVLLGVNESVKEVFTITGFSDILTIQ